MMNMDKKVLLIDDQRDPEWILKPGEVDYMDGTAKRFSDPEVEVARHPDQGLSLLQSKTWDLLLLDHDLGASKDGMDVLKFLQENPSYMPKQIYLVTANTPAGNRMMGYLKFFHDSKLIEDYGWIR